MFSLPKPAPPLHWWQTALYRGPLWVDFFFVLSGFVMALVYGRSVMLGLKAYLSFLSHRICRI